MRKKWDESVQSDKPLDGFVDEASSSANSSKTTLTQMHSIESGVMSRVLANCRDLRKTAICNLSMKYLLRFAHPFDTVARELLQ